MTKSRKRKAATASGLHSKAAAWRDVTVSLGDDGNNNNNNNSASVDDVVNDASFYEDKNHYDDPALLRSSKDLEAVPGEQVAMFYGLQVIDGSQYTLTETNGTTQFRIVNEHEDQQAIDAAAAAGKDNNDNEDLKSKKSNKKGHGKVKDAVPETIQEPSPSADVATDQKASKKRKKKKKRSKKKDAPKKDANETIATATATSPTVLDLEQIQAMQNSWMVATAGVTVHERLCASLLQQEFWTPTPIQAAVLPAAVLGRRNIVGAAPTGSGKTLAFLLPIFQYLLLQKEEAATANDPVATTAAAAEEATTDAPTLPIQALILTPTRELALQIHNEAEKLCKGNAGLITGGFAHAKQFRVLEKNRPAIIVATPGRLWELISSGEHEHLQDLSQIRFLVIDEADRMVQQGSFKELSSILDAVQAANPMDEDDSDDEEDGIDDNANESRDPDRMFGLPGVPGEARVEMLSDEILQQMRQQQGGGDEQDDNEPVKPPLSVEMDDDEFEQLANEQQGVDDDSDSEAEISLPALPPVYRQTFVYSATLTLPSSHSYKKTKTGKHSRRDAGVETIDGAIAEILEKARAKGKTKVVDLTNADKSGKVRPSGDSANATGVKASASQFRLPPGLSLQEIKCTQRHKDSHLYAYLMTTVQGSSGPCLVFCNSIACVRRVGTTLETLGIPVRVLHAQMQQRARLKAVESLKDSKERTVVVATDVAARGLDIPSVATVVHYDAPRNVDTFVHRSGRTARGVGEDAVGISMSLIAPSEDKSHARLVQSLEASFEEVIMDSRLFKSAQERVNLASKIVLTSDQEQKTNRQNKWFHDSAAEAGLEIDDEMLDEGLAAGDRREQSQLREAKKARTSLRQLLTESMQTQRYGKFLSTNSAARDNAVVPAVASKGTSVQQPRKGRRLKKRQRR